MGILDLIPFDSKHKVQQFLDENNLIYVYDLDLPNGVKGSEEWRKEDLNKILSLIDNLDEIDENTDIEILDKEIDSMGKQMEEKYKDLLSENDLDSEK